MKKTKGERFAGVTVALVTPFRGGEIDFAALRQLVDWHIEQGTDCLSPVGTSIAGSGACAGTASASAPTFRNSSTACCNGSTVRATNASRAPFPARR